MQYNKNVFFLFVVASFCSLNNTSKNSSNNSIQLDDNTSYFAVGRFGLMLLSDTLGAWWRLRARWTSLHLIACFRLDSLKVNRSRDENYWSVTAKTAHVLMWLFSCPIVLNQYFSTSFARWIIFRKILEGPLCYAESTWTASQSKLCCT